ncbi:alpha-keto acid decarboxylase family protein [Cohnella nanjingensis]|uniref:Alpha-keto-acid decarboxylase n=1 Tax=Cohnella nanjingensis TaxID=1387779 RepID=A0A7X0RU28_9BACL|nr:thiamine pyrophosphate-binding protein [Cohnella nanjingensis]MBB6672496.1 alpha-keto acid decarboxylase family protein [Cohnella nanjingensis]
MVAAVPGSRPTTSPTLGQYLYDSLKAEGIFEIFGIPGDYNFSLLDTLERYEGIRFVNGRNELGAGYAADGYARIRGMSALITTFGVGEMSACNTIAGAYSERVPIIHIVGAPKSADQQAHKWMHHTLLDGNYDVFRNVYAHLSAYTAVLTPENAAIEIPAAIRAAKQTRKPVYLVVAIDLVTRPIVLGAAPAAAPAATNPAALQAAIDHIQRMLNTADRAVLLADMLTLRFGWREAVRDLAVSLNVPAASLLLGKGAFDEQHANYIGVYGGAFGSEQVRKIVEGAGCILSAGLVWTDVNSANDTAKLDAGRLIDIQPRAVRVGDTTYDQVPAMELFAGLRGVSRQRSGAMPQVAFPYDRMVGEPEQPIRAASYYPRLQRMLKEKDIVVVETGTLAYGMSQVRLPAGADYICQQGWQSIGYATPAALGAAIAAPDRRVLLFTGDGSLQLTVQEISTMLYFGCRPIVFVLNNGGYTIEKYLNVKTANQAYNQIPDWRYTKLAEAFGGQAFTAQARTNRELDDAIAACERERPNRLCIVELIVSDPLDAPDYLHRLRHHLVEQERMRNAPG